MENGIMIIIPVRCPRLFYHSGMILINRVLIKIWEAKYRKSIKPVKKEPKEPSIIFSDKIPNKL